jgi:hypothetical protein
MSLVSAMPWNYKTMLQFLIFKSYKFDKMSQWRCSIKTHARRILQKVKEIVTDIITDWFTSRSFPEINTFLHLWDFARSINVLRCRYSYHIENHVSFVTSTWRTVHSNKKNYQKSAALIFYFPIFSRFSVPRAAIFLNHYHNYVLEEAFNKVGWF